MSDQGPDVIAPYGGTLRNLVVDAAAAADVRARARDVRSWALTPRQVCDLELLLNGGFSPLTRRENPHGILGEVELLSDEEAGRRLQGDSSGK